MMLEGETEGIEVYALVSWANILEKFRETEWTLKGLI